MEKQILYSKMFAIQNHLVLLYIHTTCRRCKMGVMEFEKQMKQKQKMTGLGQKWKIYYLYRIMHTSTIYI